MFAVMFASPFVPFGVSMRPTLLSPRPEAMILREPAPAMGPCVVRPLRMCVPSITQPDVLELNNPFVSCSLPPLTLVVRSRSRGMKLKSLLARPALCTCTASALVPTTSKLLKAEISVSTVVGSIADGAAASNAGLETSLDATSVPFR